MKIYHYSPFPPVQNGIADYAARVTSELHKRLDIIVVSENPFTPLKNITSVCDPAQTWRYMGADDIPMYQIGNNSDHVEILKQALRVPGLVILHDLKLLYLHELSGRSRDELRSLMVASNPVYGGKRADRFVFGDEKMTLDYMAIDMLWDVLHRSLGVVVHSEFAKMTLCRNYGEAIADRIHVIPHYAMESESTDRALARAALGISEETTLIVTSGFATKAKRLDWLAEALSKLAEQGHDFRWVHVGSERTQEFDFSGSVNLLPALKGRFEITGYVPESMLENYIAASNILVNLRFPSVGESSGSLARAFASGRCSLVTNTAAYADYPDDVVVKVPYIGGAEPLQTVLSALLRRPEAVEAFGENAKSYANAQLSISSYTDALLDAINAAKQREPLREVPLAKAIESNEDIVRIGPIFAEDLTGDQIDKLLPIDFIVNELGFKSLEHGQLQIEAKGVALRGRKS